MAPVGRLFRAACVFSMVAMTFAGTARAQSARPAVGDTRLINAVVASIDGKAITLREFEAYENGRGRLLPPEQRQTRDAMLHGMVEEALLTMEFQRQQISADDEDTQYYIDRVLQMNHSSRAEVEKALSEIGLHWSDYFERMRFEVEKLALINRDIRSRIHVTDEEVERYWVESADHDRPPRHRGLADLHTVARGRQPRRDRGSPPSR